MTRRSHIVIAAAMAGTVAIPATAMAGVPVDLGPQAWTGSTPSGFATAGPNLVTAAQGTYGVGNGAAYWWCDPYAGSQIEGAVVNAKRGQAASSVVIKAGPTTSGDGGVSLADSNSALATGTTLLLSNLATQCVGAGVVQSSIGTSGARQWTLGLGNVTLLDEQGPAVSSLELVGSNQDGWYTGQIKVFWISSDNELLRGTTGVQVSAGPSFNLGDPSNSSFLSQLVDPGADGPHKVTVYRTGGGGWPTAEASVSINVDRTPPTIPEVIAPPAGQYPAVLATTGSSDGPSGSGVARIEFTDNGGQTVLASGTLTVPGTYALRARAVDVAGNTSAWGLPVDVVVPAGAGTPGHPGSAPHLARITIDGRSPDASGGLALTRTWHTRIRLVATFADGLGAPAARIRVAVADALGRLVVGTTGRSGRITLEVPVRRSGTELLSADGGTPVAMIALRMRPLVTLDRSERHAMSGRPLTLGPHRTLTVTGHAAPGVVVVGQPVELQYLLGRTWLPLGLPGAVGRGGRWRVSYAVARPGSARVVMRVVLPSQPGLPFAAGASPRFTVAIR
jgi:hypothetical protein